MGLGMEMEMGEGYSGRLGEREHWLQGQVPVQP